MIFKSFFKACFRLFLGGFSRVLIKDFFKVSFRIFVRFVLGFSFGDFSRVLV